MWLRTYQKIAMLVELHDRQARVVEFDELVHANERVHDVHFHLFVLE